MKETENKTRLDVVSDVIRLLAPREVDRLKGMSPDEFTNLDLPAEVGLDSLDSVDIALELEDRLGATLLDGGDDVMDTGTPATILNHITRRLGPESPVDGRLLTLTDDQFINRYKPEKAEDGGYYRQRYWDNVEDMPVMQEAFKQHRLWTVVDDDDGLSCIVAGDRMVNRTYHVITENPHNDEWDVQVPASEEERRMVRAQEVEDEVAERNLTVIRCLVFGEDADYNATVHPCVVACRLEDIRRGHHLVIAASDATAHGLGETTIPVDERAPLFGMVQVDWSALTCPGTWVVGKETADA